jgi:HSP20 family molecular chaperone IbpA
LPKASGIAGRALVRCAGEGAPQGHARRSFALPDGVDRDKIGAEFAKGVLMVTMPKLAEAKTEPKKIEVKAAA